MISRLVAFYGIKTLDGYSMPNPVYRYMLDIYDLLKNSLSVKIFQTFVFT